MADELVRGGFSDDAWLERGTLRGRLELVIAPGPVLLRLARRGFGVLLPEPEARVDGAMPR